MNQDKNGYNQRESRKAVEAVVFDLDGTLLDTLADLHAATNYALSRIGQRPRTMEEVRGFVGNGVVLLMERAVPGGRENPRFEEALKMFKEYYKIHSLDQTGMYVGIPEMLAALKREGIKLGIVSNKPDFAVKELNRHFFREFVSSAAGEREEAGIRKKPAPDAVFEVLKELNVSAENAVYVGDSEVDIQTAKNAGMRCISVSWGFKSAEFLWKNEAKVVIDRPEQLLEYIF